MSCSIACSLLDVTNLPTPTTPVSSEPILTTTMCDTTTASVLEPPVTSTLTETVTSLPIPGQWFAGGVEFTLEL